MRVSRSEVIVFLAVLSVVLLSVLAQGAAQTLQEGDLAVPNDQQPKPLYLIERGKKRWIPDMKFLRLAHKEIPHLSNRPIRQVPTAELNKFDNGPNFEFPISGPCTAHWAGGHSCTIECDGRVEHAFCHDPSIIVPACCRCIPNGQPNDCR
jgi:hypothetical protein